MASRNRGKPKRKIGDLSRLPSSDEETSAIFELLGSEPHPIVIAVLSQAIIENELEQLLRTRFVRNDDQTWTLLTNETGPLSTFYTKIISGYAFRLFDEITRENLHVIRKIRNAFAHGKRVFDFEHELVIAELRQIKLPATKRGKIYRKLKDAKDISVSGKMSFMRLIEVVAGTVIQQHAHYYRNRTRWLKRKSFRPLKRGSKRYSGLLAELLSKPDSIK